MIVKSNNPAFGASAVLLIFFLLSSCFLYGQNYSHVSLEWGPVKTLTHGDDTLSSFDVLSFRDGHYSFDSHSLPFYSQRIPLPSSQFSMRVSLSDTVFQAFPVEDFALVEGIDDLTHGIQLTPGTHSMRKQIFAFFHLVPAKLSLCGDSVKLLQSFHYEITFEPDNEVDQRSIHQYTDTSVLARGPWHKLRVPHSGIFRITYNNLASYGIDVSNIDPSKLQIYGNGGTQLPYNNSASHPDDLLENAIYVSSSGSGSFSPGDYILFYAQGPVEWTYDEGLERFLHHKHEYDDYAYYFLTYNQKQGKRILEKPSVPGSPTITTHTYDSYRFHEKDSVNLLKSGRRFFGDVFDIITNYTYSFDFPDLAPSHPVKFRMSMAARSTQSSSFKIDIHGNTQTFLVSSVPGGHNDIYAHDVTDTFSLFLNPGAIHVDVSYLKPQPSAVGWMDYIQVQARENLFFRGSQLPFRDASLTGSGHIVQYSISGASSELSVWDITDPVSPMRVSGHLSGNTYTFSASSDTLREFLAHKDSYYSPHHVGKIENQNLHGLPRPDMVIVTHPDLLDQAEEIADLHRDMDNMVVHVVTPQKVYNEFSSGQQDVSAIRNFMRMFYDRASTPNEIPGYLLLLGDGNYDPKNRNGFDKATMITFQSSASLSPRNSFVSDDFFGLYAPGEGSNASGSLDIGVGRIPAGTVSQARQSITKMRRYLNMDTASINNDIRLDPALEKPLADWRNVVCLVADDEDNNVHVISADLLADQLNSNQPEINVQKIYFDAYQQITTPGGQRYPDVNNAINEQMQKGALIMQYVGHGGPAGWAHEEVLRIQDIRNWSNKYNMPLFLTTTCEFSPFDNPSRVSAGEIAFHHPDGGAISLITSTRIAYSGLNMSYSSAFYDILFRRINGSPLRMGDAIRLSKKQGPQHLNIRSYVLLGNPALPIAFPDKKVVTTSINEKSPRITDTLRALSHVTVSGKITNANGNIDSTFNGFLYPTVYDKKSRHTTLGQDPGSHPFEFEQYDNILFKGKGSVTNGRFTFSFIVPKDIAYNYGHGRISYYAEDGIRDASGYYDKFIVGGTSSSAAIDTSGPDIDLFMNDFSFVSGGITDQNPILLARVYDEHGINAVGSGIGHDIVATLVLEDNTQKQFVLNNYYEADLNDFTRGTIRYPLHDLPPGRHQLSLKVWDIYNNSNEATIHFVVTHSEKVVLKNLRAYPNPSDGEVWFTFDHNQARTAVEFQVDIFSLDGRLMETLKTSIAPEGYSVSPLKWYGRTASGTPVKGGMYIYKATIRTESGISKSQSGKLVIQKPQ